MLIASELTLAGVPALKVPDNWPGYDNIAQPKSTGSESIPARGRVKRRSQPIIRQYNVAARTVIWRRFRIYYLKGNRIAGFRQDKGFSHGCAGRPARSRWCKSTAMKE